MSDAIPIRTLPDPLKAWEKLEKVLPAEEFMGVCKIGIGDLQAALQNHFGWPTKIAKAQFNDLMGDAIVMDRLCHASLIDGARLSGARLFVYRHRDVKHAEHVLKRSQSYRRRVLVTDSIFSMDGDIAPVKALSGLLKTYDAIGVLDEAHALGVWGPKGRGIAAQENVLDSWHVIVGTLSKSLGAQGGFVAVSESLKRWFVNRSRSFIYTTGLSPLLAEAAREALFLLQTMDAERSTLQLRSNTLNQSLQQKGYHTCGSQSQIVPILLGAPEKALAFSKNLEANGFFAPAIRPPTVPNGECRIRFSLTTEQTDSNIEQLIQRISHGPY
jgi:8-amino-7-oxononanoate synthase